MQVLIMERGTHIDPEAVRRDCPDLHISYVRSLNEAMPVCQDAEILVAMAHEVEDELLMRMPKLRYICALTTGTEHLDGLKALPSGVVITNGRGMHGPQMSELTFLYMLALSRDFPRMLGNQGKAAWERWPQRLLLGKSALLVGIGAIAEELAARCKAFGMNVYGISDARSSAPGFDGIFPRAELAKAAALADFLVVLVPLSSETRHMIDGAVLDAMKPTAVVINIARGPVVDQKALTERLLAGRLGGAGLDVFEEEPLPKDDPLWHLPNVIVTPRIGGMSDVYAQQVHPIVVHNLKAFADGRLSEMRNLVRGRA